MDIGWTWKNLIKRFPEYKQTVIGTKQGDHRTVWKVTLTLAASPPSCCLWKPTPAEENALPELQRQPALSGFCNFVQHEKTTSVMKEHISQNLFSPEVLPIGAKSMKRAASLCSFDLQTDPKKIPVFIHWAITTSFWSLLTSGTESSSRVDEMNLWMSVSSNTSFHSDVYPHGLYLRSLCFAYCHSCNQCDYHMNLAGCSLRRTTALVLCLPGECRKHRWNTKAGDTTGELHQVNSPFFTLSSAFEKSEICSHTFEADAHLRVCTHRQRRCWCRVMSPIQTSGQESLGVPSGFWGPCRKTLEKTSSFYINCAPPPKTLVFLLFRWRLFRILIGVHPGP